MPESVLRFRVETADANAKIAHLTKKVQALEVAVFKAGGTTKTAATGMRAMGKSAQAAAVGAKGLGAALSAALGPVSAVLAAAGSLSQIFGILSKQDFAEAKVRSLGVNSEQLTGRLKGVSRELAGQASVVELTSAAYDVASAGFTDAADAANILKAASQGATGGFSDINTVGDATTSVLNAYGLEADKAAKLVDGFIQTQNDGKIVIGEYAANIAKVAPVAAALGVPLEEVNAAVAQITAGGQGAEVTFTALKTALSQVAAGKVGQEFKKLGVEINASTLKSDGLAGTLEKIKKSGADAGTVIKAFGTEAGPSILALLNDTEKYNKLLENQKNSQGAAARAAFEASDTIQGSLKRLQTAFENLFADGKELGLLLKSVFKVAAVTVEVFGASLKTLMAPFRGLVQGLNDFFNALSPIKEGVNIAYELEQGFQSVMKAVEFGQAVITGFFKEFAFGAAQLVGNFFNAANRIKGGVVSIFGGIGDFIAKQLAKVYENLPPPFKFIIDQAMKIAGGISGAVQSVVGQGVEGAKALAEKGGFQFDDGQSGKGTTPGTGAANGISPTGGVLGGKEKERDLAKEAQRIEERALKDQERKEQSFQNQVQALHEKQAIARAIIDGNEQEVRNAFLLSKLHKAHGVEKGNILYQNHLNEQSLQRQVDESKKLEDQQNKAAENMRALYEDIGSTIKDGVVGALKGAIDGTKSLKDAALGLLDNLMNKLLDVAVNMALFGAASGFGSGGGLLGGLLKFGGGQAKGGPVSAGTSYLVGEKGPELFTPSRSGTIVPNNAMGGVGNITVNVDASGSSVQGNAEDSKRLGDAIGLAIRQELIKQKRPGGLLA